MTWPVYWRKTTLRTRALSALVPVYKALAHLHRRHELSRCEPLPVPVVLVGNIVVGGTGKTPFIQWLIEELRLLGFRPGVITRGYGRATRGIRHAAPGVTAREIGDEPVQIHQRTQMPVVVGDDRLAAARALLSAHPETSVIVSDDGLQHRRLPRAYVFCLFDGTAGMGNGRLLPAGPLREPLSTLTQCHRVVFKGVQPTTGGLMDPPIAASVMTLALSEPHRVDTGAAWDTGRELTEPVVAACGIGQPESFFDLLTSRGWRIEPLTLPDHGALSGRELRRLRRKTVFMTRKDAVKLPPDHGLTDAWVLDLDVSFRSGDRMAIRKDLARYLASGPGGPSESEEVV